MSTTLSNTQKPYLVHFKLLNYYPGGGFVENIRARDIPKSTESRSSQCSTLAGGTAVMDWNFATGFNGWLPTLDTQIQIGEDNQIYYKYFEKDKCSRKTLPARTAMNENTYFAYLLGGRGPEFGKACL